jgi:TorA maturation chaperone TorD
METKRIDETREELLGETLLLNLLGRVTYEYPKDEQRPWLQSLIDSEAFSESPYAADQPDVIAGLEHLQNWSKQGLTNEAFQDLQADHLRLFIGAGKVIAPPWESVFFNEARQTFQEQTLQVRAWYRRFGLEPEKLYHEPDDHIGLEMVFLAHLADQALQALDEGNDEKFDSLMDARRQFLSEHLLKWVGEWCSLVIENANTEFYKGVGYVIRGALLSIAERYLQQAPKEAVH